MAVYTSISSCTSIFRNIFHYIGNSVKCFTFLAFCFLTLCTQFFFFRLAQCGSFIGNTSALRICFHFSAVGSAGYLLPNGQFLFGCINCRLAFFLCYNLLCNSVSTGRFRFLDFLQCCFFVRNHSVSHGLGHSFVSLCLLNNGIPSKVGSFRLLIDRITLFIFGDSF